MMNNNRNFRQFPKKQVEAAHKINEKITAQQVRLVGDNVTVGVYSIREAIKIAQELEVDLVEINGAVNPPICRAVDYKKFLYDQKRREKEQAQQQKEKNKDLKEMRFGANTDEGDIETKKKKIIEFLTKGHKVKAYIQFKGREIQHKQRGELLLLQLATDIEEIGKVDAMPKLEGKNMIMMISPKLKK